VTQRSFAGAAALVTGGGSGLGRAIALRFAGAGANLALLDVDDAGLESTRREIESLGRSCVALHCDVTDPAACGAAIETSVAALGGLDVVVNNAGISHRSAFASTDPAVLRRVVEVNLFGSVNVTRAALPHLRRSRGLIVAISSVAGFSPLIARTGYAASKHAMHGFFESLRTEVATDGIDVMMVCPSFVATGIDRHALGADGRPAGHAQLTVGRRSTPEDAADRIVRGAGRGKRLLLIGRTAWQAWWLSRLAPSVYAAVMARRLRGEMQQG
jgi:NAD(P)-dependent dehydrogenase (short-subunit alcohol dehydrogenase family)